MIAMAMRLLPVAIVLAVLASLTGLVADGLWVYRSWEMYQGDVLGDPYPFSESLKHLAMIGVIVGVHFTAVWVCVRVLRNGAARFAAYSFLAGLVALSVLEVASVWPVISGAWPPKRYIDYADVFASTRGVKDLAAQLAVALLLGGWALLTVAAIQHKAPPSAGLS